MDNLTKIRQIDDISFYLYKCYIDATEKSFEDEVDEFNTCLNDLKQLVDKQYDFSWLSENAAILGITRKELKAVADDICMKLGERISELCKYSKEPIVTQPTRFEEYCPFTNENLVIYGHSNKSLVVDGNTVTIIDTKLESTPYYNIYCSTFE